MNPALRQEMAVQMVYGFNYINSQEGKKWIKDNEGKLLALDYFLPYKEIGTTLSEVMGGDFLSGNLGYLGGLPFGFFTNVLKDTGVIPKEPMVDEYTGKVSGSRTVPKSLLSKATVEVVMEDLLNHLFPLSLYSLTGGMIYSPATIYRPYVKRAMGTTKEFKKVGADYNILNQ